VAIPAQAKMDAGLRRHDKYFFRRKAREFRDPRKRTIKHQECPLLDFFPAAHGIIWPGIGAVFNRAIDLADNRSQPW
jgi:hypothetical protein